MLEPNKQDFLPRCIDQETISTFHILNWLNQLINSRRKGLTI